MKRRPTIITYCTGGTPYEREAAELAESAAVYGYACRVRTLPDRGRWELNCSAKAAVCRDAMRESDGPLLFLDADCRVAGELKRLDCAGSADLMLQMLRPNDIRPTFYSQRYIYQIRRHGMMWNSGVLFMQPSEATRELLDAWVECCRARPGEWDQLNLLRAWERTGRRARFVPLPADYRPGGPLIGHRSGFHRYWREPGRRPKRDVLVLGSGPDCPEWWTRHGADYVNAGFAITAMNHAWRIPPLDELHFWFHPNDYAGERPPFCIPGNDDLRGSHYEPILNSYHNWIVQPAWTNGVQTTFLHTLLHLLNEAICDRVDLNVHVAGCDMNYAGPKTHFYQGGTADPLRYQPDKLDEALLTVGRAYETWHAELWNATDAETTRLPFARAQIAGGPR